MTIFQSNLDVTLWGTKCNVYVLIKDNRPMDEFLLLSSQPHQMIILGMGQRSGQSSFDLPNTT